MAIDTELSKLQVKSYKESTETAGQAGNVVVLPNGGTPAKESGGNIAAISTTTGATNDAAVVSDADGTLSAKLRGLVKIFADVWDSSNHKLKILADTVRTSHSISAGLATDVIMNNLTALIPKFAKISASSSGNNALVSAVANKKIRVLGYNFITAGAVDVKFQSDGAGSPTDLTGLKTINDVSKGLVAPFSPVGWFETATGKSLDMNLSAATVVGGELVYIEV